MGSNPGTCPNCSERNTFNLDYCTVCGLRFNRRDPKVEGRGAKKAPAKQRVDNGELKRMRRKRALLTAFREGEISEERLRAGLRELGGSEDIERALDLKRFLEEQIKSFEGLDLSGQREGYFPDLDEPQSDLPRDENGAALTDFGASAEDRDFIKKGRPFQTGHVNNGSSLFRRGRGIHQSDSAGVLEGSKRKVVRASGVDWDEDDEEDGDHSDFEIVLGAGEKKGGEPGRKKTKRTAVVWLDDDEVELKRPVKASSKMDRADHRKGPRRKKVVDHDR